MWTTLLTVLGPYLKYLIGGSVIAGLIARYLLVQKERDELEVRSDEQSVILDVEKKVEPIIEDAKKLEEATEQAKTGKDYNKIWDEIHKGSEHY